MSTIGFFGQISEITEHLLLSGANVLKLDKLRRKKITCIVNATVEEPSTYISGIDYLKISIEDSPFARIDQYFDIVADKIKAVKDRGGRTLVHCVAGVSRSATLCMIYLVKHERMTLRQAYHYVKSARPVIKPNLGFWRQMIAYERKLKGANSVHMVETGQDNMTIPDVYSTESMRKLVHNLSLPRSISRNVPIKQIPRKYSDSQTSTFGHLAGLSLRPSTSPSIASSLFSLTSSRNHPSSAILTSALSRRRGIDLLDFCNPAFSTY